MERERWVDTGYNENVIRAKSSKSNRDEEVCEMSVVSQH